MASRDGVEDADAREGRPTREQFLKRAGAAGLAAGASGVLAACGGSGSAKSTGTGASTGTSTAAAPSESLRTGGHLRIGMGSGSPADKVDPHVSLSPSDAARLFAMYDGLAELRASTDVMRPRLTLAEEMTPSKNGEEWTIRLRDGVEFHNGKTLDIDDFIATFERITNPKTGAFGIIRWGVYDMKNARKLDKRTIRVPTTRRIGILPELMAASVQNIIPVGFDVKKPVGTGPFKLKSFQPGRQTVLERFENYWGGPAKLDTVTLIDLPDPSARYNALLSGQIDLLDGVPLAQVEGLKANSKFKVSSLPSAQYFPIYVRVDMPPFDDVRVRQALKLCVNRQQVVNSAFNGNAAVGNDVFARFDAFQDESLKRQQDLEQAKSLLKQAGREGLTATLTTAPVGAGALESTQVFAENAKDAGMNIRLRQVDLGTMYGPNYHKWPFSVDNWPGLTYLILIASATASTASVNLTHFNDKKYDSLYAQALGELDESKRKEISHELQKIDFEQGGNIIPAHPNYTAAYTTQVGGFYPANLTGETVAAGFLNKLGFVT